MNPFSALQERIGFTRNEIKVILFLSVTFLLGLGVRWYQAGLPAQRTGTPGADYSDSDSIFATRSRTLVSSAARAPGREQRPSKSAQNLAAGSVDLNAATRDQLIRLPGIGEEYAGRIIRYREEHGAFAMVDDLMKVKGIGRKKFDRLRAFVIVK